MAVIRQISLANSLAMIFGSLIHPALSGVHKGFFVRARASPAPEQVLALVRPLAAGGVLHVSDFVGKVVSPSLGIGGELIVPLKRSQVLISPTLVLNIESALLVSCQTHIFFRCNMPDWGFRMLLSRLWLSQRMLTESRGQAFGLYIFSSSR